MSNRNVQAKNRAPASIQITAEQILREAKDRQLDVEVKAPRQQITDEEELRVFRMRKRKEVGLLSLDYVQHEQCICVTCVVLEVTAYRLQYTLGSLD